MEYPICKRCWLGVHLHQLESPISVSDSTHFVIHSHFRFIYMSHRFSFTYVDCCLLCAVLLAQVLSARAYCKTCSSLFNVATKLTAPTSMSMSHPHYSRMCECCDCAYDVPISDHVHRYSQALTISQVLVTP